MGKQFWYIGRSARNGSRNKRLAADVIYCTGSFDPVSSSSLVAGCSKGPLYELVTSDEDILVKRQTFDT